MNIITFMPRQIKSLPNLPTVLVSGTIIKPYPESFLLVILGKMTILILKIIVGCPGA